MCPSTIVVEAGDGRIGGQIYNVGPNWFQAG